MSFFFFDFSDQKQLFIPPKILNCPNIHLTEDLTIQITNFMSFYSFYDLISNHRVSRGFEVWNGNFLDLQFYVEILEISGNNLWKFPKFPNFRAFIWKIYEI